MMKHFFSLCFLSILVINLKAQTGFEKVYGGTSPDWFRSVVPTSDGGIIAGGATRSFGFGNSTNTDGYVVKMNSNGDTLWTRHFGETPYDDEAFSVIENASGYLAAGYNVADTPSLAYYYYAVQYDNNGSKLWEKFYGNPGYEYCNDAIYDSHGRNVLCGSAYYGAISYDYYLIKTDAGGHVINDAHFGSNGFDWARAVIQTSDGGYAMAGYTNGGTPGYDIYVVKVDSNLNFQWSHNYGSSLDDFGYDIAEDTSGNLWILGSMEAPDSSHMVLIKTDASGNNAVLKFPGRTIGDFGYQIKALSGGGFLIGGVTGEFGKGNEMLLEKLDANGDSLWTKHFGGTKGEAGLAVATDAADNILLAGETEGFGVDQFDAYLVKTDANGEVPCPSAVSFTSNASSPCEDELVSFINTTVSSQNFSWTENAINFSNDVDAAYLFNDGGTYNVALAACSATSSQNITINSKPATHFTYTHSGAAVNFTMDVGINVQSRSWNFGDGSPLNAAQNNPTHTYTNLGMYWVILKVTNTNGCDSTYTEQIDLLTGIDETEANKFALFPNPAHEMVTLREESASAPSTIELLTADGRMIRHFSSENSTHPIALYNLSPGLYLVYIHEQSGGLIVKKLEVY